MKRIALIATAALCALAMCLCSIPALSVFAEDDTPELTNVALNSYVTVFASQALNDGGSNWFPAALTDGVKNPNNALLLAPGGDWMAPVDSPIDITMELGARYTIYGVDLYAAYDGYALPIAYTISVSDDGVDFTPAVTVTDGEQIAEKYTVEFDEPATGSYLRLTIINGCDIDWGGAAFCAIGELEAWGVAADPLPEETEDDNTEVELSNLALNQLVEVSGIANVDYIDNIEWGPGLLVDGINNGGVSGNGLLFIRQTPISDADPVNIYVNLGDTHEIYTLAVYGGYTGATAAFPRNYTLAVSTDGTDWETVATVVNGANNETEVVFELDAPVEASMIRMQITKGSGWDLSTYPGYEYLGCDITTIGEIEVWGVATASTETETEAPAVTETQAPTVTETEAPEVTETETVVETVVESDVESAEESAEESDTTVETVVDETVADTGVEETVADTTAATDAPATADEGCASVVGFGAVAVLAAAAAAVVLKKKD